MPPDRHDQSRPGDGDSSHAYPIDEMPGFFDEDVDFDPCDCFAPPEEVCECYCLHCGRVFMSDQIWFQRVINAEDGFTGFWMCPTPNCDGRGFTFDIFPTDPDHPANADVIADADWQEETDEWAEPLTEEELLGHGVDEPGEYDPDEPEYAALDEVCLDDLEGEEWKYGLQPGDPLPEPAWRVQARREWEEKQRRFDEPDERPRVIDMSEENPPPDEDDGRDIPF